MKFKIGDPVFIVHSPTSRSPGRIVNIRALTQFTIWNVDVEWQYDGFVSPFKEEELSLQQDPVDILKEML